MFGWKMPWGGEVWGHFTPHPPPHPQEILSDATHPESSIRFNIIIIIICLEFEFVLAGSLATMATIPLDFQGG